MVRDVFEGEVEPSARYPGASAESETGFSTEATIHLPSEQGVERIADAAEEVALAVHDRVPALLPCASAGDRACATEFVAIFGRRAMRRTPTSDEQSLLLGTFDDAIADGATFEEAIAMMSALLLQLPQVLHVYEEIANDGRQLTGVEIASRLSFLFWDSIPDDELLDLAESGGLDDPAVIAEQARRLLASSKADTALSRFIREWTHTSQLSPFGQRPRHLPGAR